MRPLGGPLKIGGHRLQPCQPSGKSGSVWGALQQRVYHQRQFKTVEELKRAVVTEWQKLSQRYIDNSINEWRRRPKTVNKNGGGYIEHCDLT